MFIRRSKYENIILEAFKRGRNSNILIDDNEAVRNFATEMKFKKKVFPKLEVFGLAGRGKPFSITLPSGTGMTASMVIPELQINKKMEENNKGFKNLSDCLQGNLRYTLANAVIFKYGVYNKENLRLLSEEMKVSFNNIEKLCEFGQVEIEDFIKICKYLSPDNEMKYMWYKFYVSTEPESIQYKDVEIETLVREIRGYTNQTLEEQEEYIDYLENMLTMLSKNYLDLVHASDEKVLKSVRLPVSDNTRKAIRLISQNARPTMSKLEDNSMEKFTQILIENQHSKLVNRSKV